MKIRFNGRNSLGYASMDFDLCACAYAGTDSIWYVYPIQCCLFGGVSAQFDCCCGNENSFCRMSNPHNRMHIT